MRNPFEQLIPFLTFNLIMLGFVLIMTLYHLINRA
jgi:hypothetical protein